MRQKVIYYRQNHHAYVQQKLQTRTAPNPGNAEPTTSDHRDADELSDHEENTISPEVGVNGSDHERKENPSGYTRNTLVRLEIPSDRLRTFEENTATATQEVRMTTHVYL